MTQLPFVHIVVEGGPRQRGAAYGSACRELIRANIDFYRYIFKTEGQLAWDLALEKTTDFIGPIQEFDMDIMEEIVGIAEGAGVSLEEILALNLRSELLFMLTSCPEAIRPCCTVIAANADACTPGDRLIAQNWDWYRRTQNNCVLLTIRQPPRPTVFLFAEAGLVAKIGINSAGIGLCTNALLTRGWQVGVPFHVLLRGILNASTLAQAIGAVTRSKRASAGSYLIGAGAGALCIEAFPESLNIIYPRNGFITHANHLQGADPAHIDLMPQVWPDTLVRGYRAAQIAACENPPVSQEWIQTLLRDHVDLPTAICSHPCGTKDPAADSQTNASVIINLSRNTFSIARGPACQNAYVTLEASALF
jgi:isopenicillin-N N-acyltransferase-like protein